MFLGIRIAAEYRCPDGYIFMTLLCVDVPEIEWMSLCERFIALAEDQRPRPDCSATSGASIAHNANWGSFFAWLCQQGVEWRVEERLMPPPIGPSWSVDAKKEFVARLQEAREQADIVIIDVYPNTCPVLAAKVIQRTGLLDEIEALRRQRSRQSN